MKNQIKQELAKIDKEIKEITGVDLAKLDMQLDATRKVFQGLDLNTFVIGRDIFLVKSRMKNLVH